jgi:hypothetical protein
MKTNFAFLKVLAASVFLAMDAPSAVAGVALQDDGTYLISGTWTFWPDKEILAPSGRENDFGEFETILFKPDANEFEEVYGFKKTSATFKVRARVSTTSQATKILVVEAILERVDGSGSGKTEPPEKK